MLREQQMSKAALAMPMESTLLRPVARRTNRATAPDPYQGAAGPGGYAAAATSQAPTPYTPVASSWQVPQYGQPYGQQGALQPQQPQQLQQVQAAAPMVPGPLVPQAMPPGAGQAPMAQPYLPPNVGGGVPPAPTAQQQQQQQQANTSPEKVSDWCQGPLLPRVVLGLGWAGVEGGRRGHTPGWALLCLSTVFNTVRLPCCRAVGRVLVQATPPACCATPGHRPGWPR